MGVVFFGFLLYSFCDFYGGHGEEVIITGCGPVVEGSIPSGYPINRTFVWHCALLVL